MPSEIVITIQDGPSAETKIVAFSGELDESNLDRARTAIDPLLNDASVKVIIFDLSTLEFINSKGIGYFVSVHTHLSKNQRKLIMVSAKEAVMDVISLVGLTSIIPYFETVAQVEL